MMATRSNYGLVAVSLVFEEGDSYEETNCFYSRLSQIK